MKNKHDLQVGYTVITPNEVGPDAHYDYITPVGVTGIIVYIDVGHDYDDPNGLIWLVNFKHDGYDYRRFMSTASIDVISEVVDYEKL